MSVTSTQSKVPASTTNIAVGSYIDTGTAAAFVITTGFQPRFVRIINEDGDCHEEWYEGMADAEAMKMLTGGTYAKITSNGITVSATGFTVGLDTDINVTSQQLSWYCFG